MSDNDRLYNLFVEWEERAERGEEVSTERLCRDCPELLPALEEFIQRVGRVPAPHGGSDSRRPHGGSDPRAEAEPVFRTGLEPIPGYRLIQRQGRGNFGDVWAATSLVDGARTKVVAVKFVHGSLDDPRPRILAENELEGLVRIKRISHPHVLEVLGAQVSGTTLLVVMELADRSLWDHFQNVPLFWTPLQRCVHAASLLWGIAEALDYLQQNHRLMHLDVKPANLLLVGQRCKLADFGTVKRMRAGGAIAGKVLLAHRPGPNPERGGTQTRYYSCQQVCWEEGMHPQATLYTALGAFTPFYASPEMFKGRASRSSDQYSLALTFCHLATGRVPFAGEGDEQITLRREGRLNWGALPEGLRPALAKALSPRPDDRFDSCLDFVRALVDALTPEARRHFGSVDLFPGPVDVTPRPRAWLDSDTVVAGSRRSAGRRSSDRLPRPALGPPVETADPQQARPEASPKRSLVVVGFAVLVAPFVAGYFVWRWTAWLVGKALVPEHGLVCALLLIPALVPPVVLYRCTERLAPPAPPPDVRKDEAPVPLPPAKPRVVPNPFTKRFP